MKKLSKLTALSFLFVMALFSSCKKEHTNPNNPDNPGQPSGKKIAKVVEGDDEYTFQYNTDGTLKSISTKTNGSQNPDETFSFTYDSNKRPIEATAGDGTKTKYIYTNNVLTGTEIYMGTAKVSYTTYTYQNNKLASMSSFLKLDDDAPAYTEFLKIQYAYNAAGNASEMTSFIYNVMTQQLEKSSSTQYLEYDNKINPASQFGALGMNFFMEVNSHNVLKEKSFDENGQLTETVEYTYTYDNQGYPTSCTQKTTEADTQHVETVTTQYTYL